MNTKKKLSSLKFLTNWDSSANSQIDLEKS